MTTALPSSLEIAQAATLRPIEEIAALAGLEPDEVEPYGRTKAKIDLAVLDRLQGMLGADEGEARRSWFIYALRLPAGADREAVVADLSQRGVQAKAYMPAIHLMGHMRERFGFGPGRFPVAEDASDRLLALPFFPELSEAQIDRVCEALAEALQGDWT